MYKHVFKGKKAVIFDLDGTVIDSSYAWYQALETVLRAVDPNATEEARKVFLISGQSTIDKWTTLLESNIIQTSSSANELTKTTENEFLKLLHEGEVTITEGFWDFAAELKLEHGFKLALTTNTSRDMTEKILGYLGFGQTFDLTICGDEVENPKPDPEIYLKALKGLNMSAKQTIVFEDSIVGASAATKAKIETVVIWDGRFHEQDYPEDVIGFIPDFVPFPGNLDKDIKQLIKEYTDKAIQEKRN